MPPFVKENASASTWYAIPREDHGLNVLEVNMRPSQESNTESRVASLSEDIETIDTDVLVDTPGEVNWAELRTEPLKVAHVIEAGQGGIETAVRLLVDAQGIDPSIGDIHIVADRALLGEALLQTPATMHFYKSNRKAKNLWSVSKEIYKLLARIKPDVVYLHSTFPGLYGRLYRKAGYVSWVTIYCPHGWAFTQRVSFVKRQSYMAVERMLSARADAIISVSHSEFTQAVQGGLNHHRHQVILHGIPQSSGATTSNRLPPRNEEHVHLLFLGRFDPQKGLDLLLEAWKDPRLAQTHLWIIGDAILPGAAKVSESSNVHLLGWIPNRQINSYIKSVDAVIMPSRWEAFGLVALEAMRNGKPVIASRVGGLQELVIEGVNGLFIDPLNSEALISTLSSLDKQQLANMGTMAEDIFQAGFTWESCYTRWRNLTLDTVSDYRTRFTSETSQLEAFGSRSHRLAKRLVDFSFGLIALLLLSPLLLSISIIVKLTSPGPVFFGNRRVGQNGKIFRAWKFRSMLPDSELILHRHLMANPEAQEEMHAFHKLRNDPRITSFGKFLRRTSLDELPQLFNIIVGDMSLVGPRPIIEAEIPRYNKFYNVYLASKPGLTGLWQVSGRSHATFAERIAFDEYYVRNWSIWMDIRILLRTIYVVCFAEGAY
jgi:lipopolysaccharide/colanic/teichoic acid biosynthesis glycosyltransferase/glycosyltransferase involved in cell wall biosynthesis